MSTMRTEPEAAPESAKASDEKWKTSPGGPLDGRGQTCSGERGQTSSGENEQADDGKPVTKRARMDSDGSAKTTERAIDAAEDAAEATNVDAPSRAPNRPPSKPAAAAKKEPRVGASRRNGAPAIEIPEGRMRCSRNDGKNWRCSEMAMPGHKHCQKHMRWSASGRSKQRSGAAEGAAGAKRPRWLAEENGWAHGAMPAGFPPHVNGLAGAPSPLLAAPLLNVAASALDELRHKEAVLRAMSRGVSSAFGAFGGFPGATAFSGFPGPGQAGATHRPTASKASISVDSLAGVAPAPPASPAAAAPAAKAGERAARSVECDVELVPAPAGSGRGASARQSIDLSSIDSFDALHVTLADLVGAARPAGGRYDPSALQIAYVDANGAPAVLGAEPWATFASRVAFVQARLLAPGLTDGGASMSNSPKAPKASDAPKAESIPAAPSFHAPWMVPPAPASAPAYNPFAAMLGTGAAPTPGPAPAADPATMAVLMSIFAAASGNGAGTHAQAGHPFSAAFTAAGFPKAEDAPPATPR